MTCDVLPGRNPRRIRLQAAAPAKATRDRRHALAPNREGSIHCCSSSARTVSIMASCGSAFVHSAS
jgi:hypothetical protein